MLNNWSHRKAIVAIAVQPLEWLLSNRPWAAVINDDYVRLLAGINSAPLVNLSNLVFVYLVSSDLFFCKPHDMEGIC